MKIVNINGRLTTEEHETLLNYDAVEKRWIMDSTVSKHFNKALRQGWTPIKQYVYDDGTICGMVLAAPERAITIRNVEPKKMSEKQLGNLHSANED